MLGERKQMSLEIYEQKHFTCGNRVEYTPILVQEVELCVSELWEVELFRECLQFLFIGEQDIQGMVERAPTRDAWC